MQVRIAEGNLVLAKGLWLSPIKRLDSQLSFCEYTTRSRHFRKFAVNCIIRFVCSIQISYYLGGVHIEKRFLCSTDHTPAPIQARNVH
jgi:hypothetical protein